MVDALMFALYVVFVCVPLVCGAYLAAKGLPQWWWFVAFSVLILLVTEVHIKTP